MWVSNSSDRPEAFIRSVWPVLHGRRGLRVTVYPARTQTIFDTEQIARARHLGLTGVLRKWGWGVIKTSTVKPLNS